MFVNFGITYLILERRVCGYDIGCRWALCEGPPNDCVSRQPLLERTHQISSAMFSSSDIFECKFVCVYYFFIKSLEAESKGKTISIQILNGIDSFASR